MFPHLGAKVWPHRGHWLWTLGHTAELCPCASICGDNSEAVSCNTCRSARNHGTSGQGYMRGILALWGGHTLASQCHERRYACCGVRDEGVCLVRSAGLCSPAAPNASQPWVLLLPRNAMSSLQGRQGRANCSIVLGNDFDFFSVRKDPGQSPPFGLCLVNLLQVLSPLAFPGDFKFLLIPAI